MTIAEFLKSTSAPKKREIASELGVDICQVYRWAKNKTVPEGPALVRLYLLAAGQIGLDEIPHGSQRGTQKTKKRGAK